jgi:regulator of sigma E protease
MGVLIMTVQLLFALAILVTLHELGHFLAARAFGIRVEKFYLFFDAWNKKLFSYTKGDTEYGIGWLPLGGYVKISGMIDESLDTDQLKTAPQDYEFRSKPAWQRLIVMVGGVVVNFVLGIFILSAMLMYYGETYIQGDKLPHGIATTAITKSIGFEDGDQILKVNNEPFRKYNGMISSELIIGDENTNVTVLRNGVEKTISIPDTLGRYFLENGNGELISIRYPFEVDLAVDSMPAAKAGIKKGDKIIKIDNNPIAYYSDLQNALEGRIDQDIAFTVVRGNDTIGINLTTSENGKIGIYPNALIQLDTIREKYNLMAAVPAGLKLSKKILADNYYGIKKMIVGKIPAEKAVGGPIMIAKKMYGPVWIWEKFWMATALLSLILAFMNILPIPALDGGHVVFLLIEMITGRPVSDKVLLWAQYVGMIIVLGLMVFIFGKDIWTEILH